MISGLHALSTTCFAAAAAAPPPGHLCAPALLLPAHDGEPALGEKWPDLPGEMRPKIWLCSPEPSGLRGPPADGKQRQKHIHGHMMNAKSGCCRVIRQANNCS
jgi:hypothetical protein